MKAKKNVIKLLPMLIVTAFVVSAIVFSGNTPQSAWGMTMTKETCQRCHGTDQAVVVSWHHQIRDTNNWSCTSCHKTISDGTGGYTVEIQRDCTVCHTPGYHTEPAGTNAKRHHAIRNANDYGCLHCHPAVTDANGDVTIVVSRDCFFCHTDSLKPWREVKYLDNLPTTTSPDSTATITDITSKFHDTLMYESYEVVNTTTTDKALSIRLDKDAATVSKVTLGFYIFEPATPRATIRIYPYLLDGVTVDTSASVDIRVSASGWVEGDVTSLASKMSGFTWMKFRVTVIDGPLYLSEGSFQILRPTTDPGSTNQVPIAMAGSDQIVYTGDTVNFSGALSNDPDGTIASYEWNFGDGAFAVGPTASHVYTAGGAYLVGLKVTDNFGAYAEDFLFVNVKTYSLPPNASPVANAGPDITATSGQPVTLSAAASTDSDGQVASWTWSFHDGTSASGETVTKIFTVPGTYTVSLTITDNQGAMGNDTVVVTVKAPVVSGVAPIANAGTDFYATVGETVTFNGAGSSDPDGTIAAYSWDFGDGTRGTGVAPRKAFTTAGVYVVTLTVTDNAGAKATDTVTITIHAVIKQNLPPIANAGANVTAITGQTVSFSGSGSSDPDGTIASYAWNFGDGTTATGINATKTYQNAGTFTITLTVTDNGGATATSATTATITPPPNTPPVANAGPNVTGTTGQAITFSGAASRDTDGTIVSYVWNFGDNSSANGITANKAYTAAGIYTVTLTVTDNGGATATDTAIVTVTAPPNVLPVANAGADAAAITGKTITFSGAGSTDTDGTIASYSWAFGDNTTATGVSVTKTYTTAGTYTVTLTVTDNAGGKATDTAVVTVAANKPPVANAGPDITATVNKAITLSAAGSSDSDGTIASYSWRFSNSSTTTTGVSVTKTFTSTGTYTATLTVKDDLGATATDSAVITVVSNQAPVADAGADVTATAGQTITFTGTGTDPDGTISSYSWSFGDGTTKTGATVTKSYSSTGTYTVRLTITDNGGKTATDTAIATIVANKPPVANAGPDVSVTLNQSISFSGTASTDPDGTIASYSWSFGDGTSATGMAPTKSYTSAGTYTVTLTVTDNAGAKATDTAIVTVAANKPPIANAGADVATSVSTSVTFSGAASADPDGTIASYNWTFGDGTSATGVSASKSYTAAGTYTVTLTVTDNNGATATDTAVVTVSAAPINVPPVANAGPDKTGTAGATITFTGTGSIDQDGSIVSYVWSFGDGTTRTGATVTKNYTAAGTYIVTLTVTDNTGATATDTAIATIRPRVKK